ncbi:hypothetical protein HK405_006945, partial [Cladochytrium tenue]
DPIGLVGAKQVSILQLPGQKAIAESMDIVRYVDTHWGGPPVLRDASGRDDLAQWLKDSATTMQLVNHPLTHATPLAETRLRARRTRSFNPEGLSYDDIDLFGRLRGPQMASQLRQYVDHMSVICDVPLLDAMAQH